MVNVRNQWSLTAVADQRSTTPGQSAANHNGPRQSRPQPERFGNTGHNPSCSCKKKCRQPEGRRHNRNARFLGRTLRNQSELVRIDVNGHNELAGSGRVRHGEVVSACVGENGCPGSVVIAADLELCAGVRCP